MKKYLTFLIFTFLINSVGYASDVVEINVTGTVDASTCNVTSSRQIYLGTWQATSKTGIGSGVGSTSTPVPFTMDFDCPPGLAVTMQLQGNQYDPTDDFFIGLDKSDDSAEGVVIVLHYYDTIVFNKWTSIVYSDVRTVISSSTDGINSVRMRSYYRQVAAPIKPGIANSTVTVNITYTK